MCVNKNLLSGNLSVLWQQRENPVSEACPTNPINPYGWSKLMSERMIRDYGFSSDFKYVILRYFNVAGADLMGRIGQSAPKASHLMRVACDAALGNILAVGIFGTDFDTRDGTGIRDYIHVEDLAAAHID